MDHQQQRIQHRIYRHHNQGIRGSTSRRSDNDIAYKNYQSKSRDKGTSLPPSESMTCTGRRQRPLLKLLLLGAGVVWITSILWNFNLIDNLQKQGTDLGQYNSRDAVVQGGSDAGGPSSSAHDLNGQVTKPPSFAYVFFMGACDAQHPWYRGILYNILVASYTLRSGSLQLGGRHHQEVKNEFEIVVLVQMSYESKETKLPLQDELLLMEQNIQIKYMEKPSHAINFYELIIQKLYVFTFVEYQRIIFLDGDIFPFCNIQYLVDLSMSLATRNDDHDNNPHSLQTNVVHAMYDDPVNAGIFAIQPEVGVWEELYDMFLKSQQRQVLLKQSGNSDTAWVGPWGSDADKLLKQSPYRLWNYYYTAADDANANNGNESLLVKDDGTKYTYYCSESDQGLLYYYLKFIKQDVSVIVGNAIEHYSHSSKSIGNGGGSVPLKRTTKNFLGSYSCLPPLPPSNILNEILMNPAGIQASTNAVLPSKYYSNPAMSMMDIETRIRLITLGFYRDFHHAVGYGKIWEQYRAKVNVGANDDNHDDVLSTSDYWFWILRHVLKQIVQRQEQNQKQSQQLRQQQGQRGGDGPSLRMVSEYAQSILTSLDDGTFRDKIGPPVHSVGRGDLLVVVKNE